MSESADKRTIRKAFEDWAAGTGSVFDLLAPDATWTIVGSGPVSGTYRGRNEFLDKVVGPLTARLSTPLVPTVHDIYSDGDMVIAYFDAAATARDGKPYNNTYTWYLRMQGGLIVRVVAFYDLLALSDLWRRVEPTVD